MNGSKPWEYAVGRQPTSVTTHDEVRVVSFPSPRPSPQGRGRIVRQSLASLGISRLSERWRIGALAVAAAFALEATGGRAAGGGVIKHDPPDLLFRRAAMEESARSIVLPLRTNLYLAFDAQLLRTHTVWEGPGLNLRGPPYTGEKSPFLCDIDGTVLWRGPGVFPWSVAGQPDATERPAGARFDGIRTVGGRVRLQYVLGLPGGGGARVVESAAAEAVAGCTAVRRRFEIAPCDREVRYLAHAEPGTLPISKAGSFGMVLERPGDVLLVAARSGAAVAWEATEGQVDYERRLPGENKLESVVRRIHVTGPETRCYLRIPVHATEIVVNLVTVICRGREAAREAERELAGAGTKAPELDAGPTGGASRGRAEVIRPSTAPGGPPGGDKFYRIERFPVPKQLDFLVGGMDWLSNGDLAVCTWPGEVYIVEGAQGAPEKAGYRRFARGLQEPLGLKVAGGRICVAQKCELTRLADTDGDGAADVYETLSDDWGCSGNYHAFVFGPELDAAGNFCVFPAGQRGLWEVPYLGWCLKIPAGGGRAEGFCRGLRAPNGWAAFGPARDLFVTDNQGEWVAACKLNHLRPEKFYGFPSGRPAPEAEYREPKAFEPPAVWFPRKLGPSASGIAEITDDRFGPFRGQLVVGDFQNGLLMRVALERVKSEWQGAVWPFARGFFGAVNRLAMGPDGRLYVGGCKRAWSTPAPLDGTLERVRFTGEVPFEVREVHARRDGFDLVFTKPVDPAGAANLENYTVSRFHYRYSGSYGSPEIDEEGRENSSTDLELGGASVAGDGRTVTLRVKGWKEGGVTVVRIEDLTSASGDPLWHDTFYYTLNRLPD